MELTFPDKARFAFTIFDDTDLATTENISPVYSLLEECGLRTTKSVWVYPPRGRFSGASLHEPEYRKFILNLQAKGFEIALHGVGDGEFTRREISDGLNLYKEILGTYPKCHANHSNNPDNLYWGHYRFEWPVSTLYQLLRDNDTEFSGGSNPESPFFWGDLAKQHIHYFRNLTFNNVNTLACDPLMPYPIARKFLYSNDWFSSSDGHTVTEMNELIKPENIDRLESEGGVCIAYTHFGAGFVDDEGGLDGRFSKSIRYLSKKNGYFVPVGQLLDFLKARQPRNGDPGLCYLAALNIRWMVDRIIKKIRFHR